MTSASSSRSHLVTSRAAWRRELARWQDEQTSDGSDSDSDQPSDTTTGQKSRKPWLPLSLCKLFGSSPATRDRQPRPRRTYTEEAIYDMELLAAEMDDPEETLDDGALAGSGDEYNPLDA